MNQSGNNIDFLIAFGGGLLMSFTPCVYPLIPISAGNIAARSGGSKIKGLSLSIVYVLGVAITYSALGLIASLTGTLFGRISTHPATHIIIGSITVLFGFSLLDIFHIHIPHKIKAPVHEHDYLYTFLLGLSSGLITSPCLTPVLGSILFYLTTKQNVFYGATLLFSFAFGMGFILILIGAFEGFLVNLPKSGNWMVWIKRCSAVILMVMGAYFIYSGIRRM
jgi:thiol:disulfide interchange protein DsbD